MRPVPSSRRRGFLPDTSMATSLAACGLILLLAWLGWWMMGAASALRDAAQRAIQVAELQGRIAYLDEYLTMSTSMAAVTGEPRWVQRYEDAAPNLDAAIAEALALARPEARATLAATMIEAHRDLMQMERRALSLSQTGQLQDARSLVNGAEFNYIQDVYAAGMEVFGQDLKGDVAARATVVNDRTWMHVAEFGIGTVLIVIAVMMARQRARLRAAMRTDTLTQLANRRQFDEQLALGIGCRSVVDGRRSALVIFGIDHFKSINDIHGHAIADQLLQSVAARLRAAAPPGTPMARVGGDEFALLIHAHSLFMSGETPTRRIMASLSEPHGIDDGIEITLDFSAGAAWIEEDVASGVDLMRQASAALRQAKNDGRGCLRIFDHGMGQRLHAMARLGGDLREAVKRDEIVPFFQPLVDFRTGQIVGVETLARWHHPERGWVPPAEFIPMAEDLGLIDALTQRLLRRACEAALPWPEHVTLAFNVSPVQLRDGALPGQIRAILAATAFPAHRLEVEVTESALVKDLDFARGLLEELRASGVRLALDDFGTGYSSLRHLHCLPFDKLKIDAGFVRGMRDAAENTKIVAAVIGLGHSLGLSTVAEGVETAEVADLLRELGCDIGQGWLFGRPAPAAELNFPASQPLLPALVA